MAEHLARIIGTEEDRVNCPFYWKIGACRHGDQCSRAHYKPTCSQTLILRHMYQNPPAALAIAEGQDVADELADQAQEHFEMFYNEVFEELAKYGELEEMVVCDNIGDHMIGNVYVKFANEDDAEKAIVALNGRYYEGRLIQAEFSPVTDFREARCRQFVDGQCTRGGYCNFMHMKHMPRCVKRKVFRAMYTEHPEFRHCKCGCRCSKGRRRSRSRSASRRRSRSRSRDKKRRGGDDRDRRREKEPNGNERQSSEERRAMIEQWNREAEGAAEGGA